MTEATTILTRADLQVTFSFADPLLPKDIGLGNDPRRVAIGLVA